MILLVAIPLAVALAFAGRALTPSIGHAVQAGRLTTAIEVAEAASDLTYHLQRERADGSALLASRNDTEENFTELAKATDTYVDRYRAKRAELSSMPEATEAALSRIDKSLERLPTLRAQVRSGNSALSTIVFGYRIAIADLITFRDSIAQADGVDPAVADRIRAAAALSETSEHLAQQEIEVVRAIAEGGFTPASLQSFQAARIGYSASYSDVAELGPAQWRVWMEGTLSGPKALTAESLSSEAVSTPIGQELSFGSKEWTDALGEGENLLYTVIKQVDADVHDTVSDQRTSLIWSAIGELALIALSLVGVVLIALRLGRDLIRRLRVLRDAAHDVAHKRLPEQVRRLSEPGAVGRNTPDDIARGAGDPLEGVADDELGEVGRAFNSLHYAAVRLAAEQAGSHDRFAQTLVTVARRGARLNSVLTAELSTVQREELDPERMKALFALDHLAIRMERNANNLLVLGGYGVGRVRPTDAPCTSVIYAAAQQIEHYGRVSPGHVEPTITIAARVVDDIAHLLAELLDNATRFSPPHTQVGVAAWSLMDRAVLQIVDEGVGMSDERRDELNAELAAPQGDIGAVRTMGLQVVARLAARHKIDVELRTSSSPGTIVEVVLPKELLARRREEDEQPPEPPVETRHDREPHLPVREQRIGDDSPRSHEEDGALTASFGQLRPAVPGQRVGSDDRRMPPAGTGSGRTGSRQDPAPRPAAEEPTGQPGHTPGGTDPVKSRIAGVSASGLPIRKRAGGPGPGAPTRPQPAGPSTAAPAAGTPAQPERRRPPRRRDSRQVSDVFAAYAQGISRGSRRGPAPQETDRKTDGDATSATASGTSGLSDDNSRSTR